jgi:hypothetical protein
MHRSLAALFVGTFLASTAAAQTFTIANSTVGPTANGNNVDVIIRVDSNGKDSRGKLPLSVSDLSKMVGGAIEQVGGPSYLEGNAKKSYWRTTWQIVGLRPGATETHLLLLKLGDSTDVLPLTFRGPADLQVSIIGPGIPTRLSRSRTSQFQLSSTGVLTHVILTQVTLVEEKTGEPLPLNKFALIDTSGLSSPPLDGLTLKESAQPLYLRVSDEFSKPGKFTGNIGLGSREKSDLGTFSLTVYSTSRRDKIWGLLFLFLGLLTFFVISVWVKARSRWILALLPAVRLREEASQLLLITEGVQKETGYIFPVLLDPPGNPGSLRNILYTLSDEKLKEAGFLPWKFAIPFTTQDLSIQYQSFLLATGNQVSLIGIIVRWGLASVKTMWPQVVKLNLQATGKTALGDLDNLGLFSGPPSLVTTQIQTIVSTLATAISNAGGAGGGQPIGTHGIAGSQQLTVELEKLSVFVWVAWAVLTLAVGYSALVWFNDGFGTGQDLVQCFLWGAGMPAVGQGFGALSAASVTSAFSLQISR